MDIRNLLPGVKKTSTPAVSNKQEGLTPQEVSFLLNLVARSTFEGKNVFLVNSIVTKLSSSIESEGTEQAE